ncbi:transcriptional regulator, LytTR family [Treponema bryantii]|uniref:Transcriptional regulator, LytTR family n=1 Tax=Treponema bryantii TaxID=163 RepID=A0A1H8ZZX5_9SPIR|nr:LytTR family DNA-binding domain-containing protein [Treponema bryantii]SEP69308.1 transcriptional regulator, LytTR family [Treponema bryantii]
MKITIQTDASVQETTLNITCREITPELERLIEALRVTDKKLSVKVNGEIHLIDLKAILYVETVERCTFIYTEDGVFETSLRLYELEAMLAEHNFFRINKSTLLNLNKIESLKSDIDRKIRVRLKNGYQLIISRAYSEEFKSKIGVR